MTILLIVLLVFLSLGLCVVIAIVVCIPSFHNQIDRLDGRVVIEKDANGRYVVLHETKMSIVVHENVDSLHESLMILQRTRSNLREYNE